jgi:hypothetical protein
MPSFADDLAAAEAFDRLVAACAAKQSEPHVPEPEQCER